MRIFRTIIVCLFLALFLTNNAPARADVPPPPGSIRSIVDERSAWLDDIALEPAAGQNLVSDVIGQIGGPTSAVAKQGDYLYIGVGPRLVVLDSTPNNLTVIGQTDPLPDIVRDVAIAGVYAYVADGSAGLRIFNVANPVAPREVGSYNTPGYALGVTVADAHAYIADGSAGLRIINIVDPAIPHQVGFYDTPGSAWSVVVSGIHAYVADSNSGLRIVNITNPVAPREVGFYDTSGSTLGVAVVGAYAYIADGIAGLRIMDIADPVAPHELGFYDTLGGAYDVTVAGTYAYIADGVGLRIVDITDPIAPREAGFYDAPDSVEDVTVTGAYAYVADRYAGLRIVNIADPAVPTEIDFYDTLDYAWGVTIANTHAYVAEYYSGLRIVDIADPVAPREVGFYHTPGSAWGVMVFDTLAYVADGAAGLRIVDIADPTAPRGVGFHDTPGSAEGVTVAGIYAYIADGAEGLRIVDVSDPTGPREVGFRDTPGYAENVAVSGTYAYVADAAAGLRIIDISDPTTPREVGFCDTPGYALSVAVADTYAYITDGYSGLRIVDIANPAVPREVSFYNTPGYAEGVTIAGTYAYVTDAAAGLRIVDIANPTIPREVGFYDTPGYALGVTVTGARILVADGPGGLTVLSFTPIASRTIPATGGNLVVERDHTTYTFPAGVFAEAATATHWRRSANTVSLPGNLARIGHFFEASAISNRTGQPVVPVAPFSIAIGYNHNELGAAIENTLALYAWDGAGWVKEPTSAVNTVNNTVTATPNRFARWAVLGKTTSTYLPLISRTYASQVDLTITGLEVTQAVQNPENSVPLIADRPTVVRVYAQTTDAKPTNGVYLTLTATRDGQPLPGSPIIHGPWAVFPKPDHGRFGNSFNILLPAQWLAGDVILAATVDSSHLIRETDENNNTASVEARFNRLPSLSIKLVPVNYTETPTGRFFPAPTTDTISEWVLRSYPVHAINVSFHAPVDFTGDLSITEEWHRLLNQVTAMKEAEGVPASQIYYGVIPISNPAGNYPSLKWGGMGWLHLRASIGVDKSGGTLAHEVGHNFRLPHAPCGNPGGPDPFYPYPNASIGQYGLDVFRMRIWTPDAPDYTKDVMSYCGPRWFSDYNYKKLYEDQRIHGVQQSAAVKVPSLLIRAQFHASNVISLQPAYTMLAVPDAPKSSDEHVVELLDEAERVVASYAVQRYIAEEQGFVAQTIIATVPLPKQPVAGLRLVQAGRLVAQRSLHAQQAAKAAAPTVEQATDIVTLRWGAPTIPALVRYTVDSGKSWTTVGLDVFGGELRVNPKTLPGGAGYFEITLADQTTLTPYKVSLAAILPDAAPQAWINGPTAVQTGQPLILIGHGDDREDGALQTIGWKVDGVEVEAGQILQLDGLAPGDHTVTLTVRDSVGHIVETTQRITVTAEEIRAADEP